MSVCGCGQESVTSRRRPGVPVAAGYRATLNKQVTKYPSLTLFVSKSDVKQKRSASASVSLVFFALRLTFISW
jgi:hypothetical protein